MAKSEDSIWLIFSHDNYDLINIQCLIANIFDKVHIADVIFESCNFIHVNFVRFILNFPTEFKIRNFKHSNSTCINTYIIIYTEEKKRRGVFFSLS